jgi:hypothetical protein
MRPSKLSLVAFSALGLTAFGLATFACSSPAPSKTLVVQCDPAKDTTCKKTAAKGGTNPGDSTDLGSGTDDKSTTKQNENPTPAPDAGTDAPATITPAPSCVTLKPCCVALRKNYSGSANQCDKVYADNDNYACSLATADYQKPEDGYDPPAECL